MKYQIGSAQVPGSKYLPCIIILFSALVITGCSSTASLKRGYDPSSDQSTFASKRIVMGYRDMSAGLATNQRIMWQAQASCTGRDCIPSEINLVFFNDTSRNLNLDYRGLQIIVDGRAHSWEDVHRLEEPANYRVPHGEFTRVSLSPAVFMQLAEAQQVEVLFGETATSVFTVSHSRRADFRAFVAAMREGE